MRLTATVSDEVGARIGELAVREKRSVSQMVAVLLERGLGAGSAGAGGVLLPVASPRIEPPDPAPSLEQVLSLDAVGGEDLGKASLPAKTPVTKCPVFTPRGTRCKMCGKVH